MARSSRAQTAAAARSKLTSVFVLTSTSKLSTLLSLKMGKLTMLAEASAPHIKHDTDDEMVNEASEPASPKQDGTENEAGDDMDPEERDDQGTPAVDSDTGSRPSTPAPGRASASRRRRAGRPPKRGSSHRNATDDLESRDAGSDVGTPRKRGGWRGRGFVGGRWGNPRDGQSLTTQDPHDKDGNVVTVKNDEIELEMDEEGEQKVDQNGHLKGGREYRVRTFSIEDKGDRLYMLSTEPARCVGFRDSYLFFQKHKNLYKIILAEEAKKDLIERNLIPHSYKGRAIGVVTARSVFREFGARIIIGGKKIIDDYQVQAARAMGEVEGESANPEDRLPGTGETYDRNQYVAWHGASAVYHTGAPNAPLPNGKVVEGKKRKVIVTGVNWMFEHAREARYECIICLMAVLAKYNSRFNSSILRSRYENLNGLYDIHSNVMQYPKIMQPTHSRWERVLPKGIKSKDLPQDSVARTKGNIDNVTSGLPGVARVLFSNVPTVFTRNFMVSDTYYVTPSTSTLGYPGPDEDLLDVGPRGLTHVPEYELAALPEGCRQAFIKARSEEQAWKETWGDENDDSARAKLRITYNT